MSAFPPPTAPRRAPRFFRLGKKLLGLGLLAGGWAATGRAAENPLQIALVSEVATIQAGQPFYVGLHLRHPEGYHSYWKYAGIVGLPTAMRWKLPEGWSAGEIEWPAPERVFMFEIKAQGFHGEKLLPIKLTPPRNLRVGETVKLEGKAVWMCCGPNCYPGFQDLSLELPVNAEAPQPSAVWAARFAEARAAVAQPSTDWTAEAERVAETLVLHLKPRSAAAQTHLAAISEVTFFTEDGLINSDGTATLTKTADEIVLSQRFSEQIARPLPKTVNGIVQTPQGWLPEGQPRSIRISPALP